MGAAVPVFLSFWGVLGGDVDVAAVVCASLRGCPESETRRESERRLSTYKEEVAIAPFFSGEVFEAGPDFVGCSERAFTSLSLGLRDIVNKLIRVNVVYWTYGGGALVELLKRERVGVALRGA